MPARRLTAFGAVLVAASLAVYAWLHVTPPSADLDWRRRTISQYALLENGWAFDVATLLLAAGSAAVLAALVRSGAVRARSGAFAALALWVAGLIGVVVFEKHNWAAGPSISGDVHRAASLLAFLSLPAGAVLAGAPWLRRRSDRQATRAAAVAVFLAGIVSLLCFSPILWALVSETWTGVRWWHAIPLGGVERLLGAVEVSTVLLLARWAFTPAATDDPDRSQAGTLTAGRARP
ncbi:DUF998 domain-containing protein [Actinoplanes sp. NPDC051633]|uniref:DUF998 domain-containing protein n=1 Tax=Actinoplanes sp. NPDC051633 TaxID=3155670 RepID=UPI003416C454